MNALDRWFTQINCEKSLRESAEARREKMRRERRDPEHPDHDAYYAETGE